MMDWASRWCRCWYLLGALLCLNKGDSLHSCTTATTPHMVGASKPKRDGISQYLKGVFISFSFWLSAMKAASLKEVATWWLDWPILIQQICLVFILSPGIKLDAPAVLHSIHEEPGLELLSLYRLDALNDNFFCHWSQSMTIFTVIDYDQWQMSISFGVIDKSQWQMAISSYVIH